MTTIWDPSLIQISSSAITAFEGNTSVVLTVSVSQNCGKSITFEINNSNKDQYITAHKIFLTPAHIGKTTFDVGLYHINLTHATSTVTTDDGIVYVDTGINCKLVDHFAQYEECVKTTPCDDNYSFWAFSFHYLLKNLVWCDNSTYLNACQLFTTLNDILSKDYECECKK